jgi:hypothetical protein
LCVRGTDLNHFVSIYDFYIEFWRYPNVWYFFFIFFCILLQHIPPLQNIIQDEGLEEIVYGDDEKCELLNKYFRFISSYLSISDCLLYFFTVLRIRSRFLISLLSSLLNHGRSLLRIFYRMF